MSSSKPKKTESALKSPVKASTSAEKIVPTQNPDAPVTKRLHISGLTPAITLDDLNKRLSTFGSVEAVDGMGKLDALGRPRTFAYVTLSTNVGKLSRCKSSFRSLYFYKIHERLRLTKLSGRHERPQRIHLERREASYRRGQTRLSRAVRTIAYMHASLFPIVHTRLAAEREASAALEGQPKRKRQRVDGVHSSDMSPVTPEVAAHKAGWKVTEMGRVLRTVRMRPDHPLPPTLEEKAKAKSAVAATAGTHYTKGKKVAGKEGKDEDKRKRKKDPPVRARRVTIDVTKWESTLLKGMFLESQGAVPAGGGNMGDIIEQVDEASSDQDEDSGEDVSEAEEQGEEVDAVMEEEEKQRPLPKITARSAPPPPPKTSLPTPQPVLPIAAASSSKPTVTDPTDPASSIAQEKSAALSLLSSLFGNADDEDDWVAQDALDSDIDEEEILKAENKARDNVVRSGVNVSKGDVEFEVVPRERGPAGVKRKAVEAAEEEDEEDDRQVPVQKEETPGPEEKERSKPVVQAAPNLKDLFAPREEEGKTAMY